MDVLALLTSIRDGFLRLWWLWDFFVLFFVARSLWLAYVQEHYRRSIKWVLLELHIPREIRRTPRAMEQVFMTMHSVGNSASDYQEKYWDGEITMWFSCEAVSFGGEVHFYVRVPQIRRNHIEAALYAQYPEVEVTDADDYIYRLPNTYPELEKAGYKLFGNELILSNKDVYPITTYTEFEATQEEKELDPVAALLETLARIKPQEHIWMQILVRPLRDHHIGEWHKAGEKEIEKIQHESGKRKVFSPQFGEFTMIDRSPGDVEEMKAIERTISKPGFETLIRYMYMAPGDLFSSSFGRRSILSAMNQYASETYNKFKHNTVAWTLAKIWYWPYIFPGHRAFWRKVRMWENFRMRKMHPDTVTDTILHMRLFNWGFAPRRTSHMVLNAEELATIFHLPTIAVLTGPLIKRVEAKKGGPPVGLPIYGGDDEELPGITSQNK